MAGGLERCETTGKTQYATRRDARIALNKLIVRRSGHKTERNAYCCRWCGKWHLTSMGEKPIAKKSTRLEPAKRWRWSGKFE